MAVSMYNLWRTYRTEYLVILVGSVGWVNKLVMLSRRLVLARRYKRFCYAKCANVDVFHRGSRLLKVNKLVTSKRINYYLGAPVYEPDFPVQSSDCDHYLVIYYGNMKRGRKKNHPIWIIKLIYHSMSLYPNYLLF